MIALQIRNIPEEWRDLLSATAEARGQSLQNYLFEVLGDEVRRRRNVAMIQRFGDRRFGSTATTSEIVDDLRAAREGRERRDDAGSVMDTTDGEATR